MSDEQKAPEDKENDKPQQELTEEELLKKRIEELRKRDPFVYR